MSPKVMVRVAIVMAVIFLITVVVYPLLFNPDAKAPLVPGEEPIELEVHN